MDEPLEREPPDVQRLLQALEHCRGGLQELILKAVEKLPVIETPELWLETTARDLGILPGPHPRRRPEWLAAAEPPTPAESPPQDDLVLNLAAALALLPLTERQFIVLRALNFSALEIAKRFGYHPASVQKRVRQGIARLAATLAGTPRLGGRPHLRRPAPARPPSTGPQNRHANRSHLRRFARWLGSEDPEAALAQLLRGGPQAAEEMLARFRTAMLESGLSDHTVKNRLSVLRVTVRLAAEHGLIQWQLRGTR